jgi:CheY-like chemotaxis protein
MSFQFNENDSDERVAHFMNETRGLFSGKRLLLVDDMSMNREIVNALLKDTGIYIDEAENGLEAFVMVKAYPERYSLVFMDLEMPEMDGLEATRQIRALPAENAKKLPIIAMTGNTTDEDIEKCHDAGMDGHLSKPMDVDKVLLFMKKHLCN